MSVCPESRKSTDLISNNYTITAFFEAKHSNPNGDPDRNNAPRIDVFSNRGIISDVCIKRKIRDFLADRYGSESGYALHVAHGAILNDNVAKVTESLGIQVHRVTKSQKAAKAKKTEKSDDESGEETAIKSSLTPKDAYSIRLAVCDKYVDVRMFGAVLGTGNIPAGYCRGPVQVGIAESLSPIGELELSITRCASTDSSKIKETEMGRKHLVSYGLYRVEIHVSAARAAKTGLTYQDVDRLVEAVHNLWDLDMSAARTGMSTRCLFVFRHEAEGRTAAPAHEIRKLIKVDRIKGDPDDAATCFEDYSITLAELPQGLTLAAT
jgi:CRISPR-associated protein Csd2